MGHYSSDEHQKVSSPLLSTDSGMLFGSHPFTNCSAPVLDNPSYLVMP
jgi:hypothetical protein